MVPRQGQQSARRRHIRHLVSSTSCKIVQGVCCSFILRRFFFVYFGGEKFWVDACFFLKYNFVCHGLCVSPTTRYEDGDSERRVRRDLIHSKHSTESPPPRSQLWFRGVTVAPQPRQDAPFCVRHCTVEVATRGATGGGSGRRRGGSPSMVLLRAPRRNALRAGASLNPRWNAVRPAQSPPPTPSPRPTPRLTITTAALMSNTLDIIRHAVLPL